MKAKHVIDELTWLAIKNCKLLIVGALLVTPAPQMHGQEFAASPQKLPGPSFTAEGGRIRQTFAASTSDSQGPSYPTRAALGFRLSKDSRGAVVLGTVNRDSPAERAGLRAGDRVLAINGLRIKSAADVDASLSKENELRDLRVLFDRDDHVRQLVLRVETRNPSDSILQDAKHTEIGITMSEDNTVRGVRVAELFPGGPADEAGLQSGDLITAVNGKRVASVEELQAAIRQHRPGDELDLSVNRDGWRRNFLLISVDIANLAKLPRVVRAATPAPSISAASQSDAHTVGDTEENIDDPYLRARYTDFD